MTIMYMTLQVLTLSVVCYRASPQPAALELCKQFFIMYGRETGEGTLAIIYKPNCLRSIPGSPNVVC